MGNVESGVQTLYCGLGITFMLGGAAAAYVKRLQSRVSDQEKRSATSRYMSLSTTHRRTS
jgi:hypothetical protein